jgi:polygalacturonase
MKSRQTVLAILVASSIAACAQDIRQISEPHIPVSCVVLDARLHTTNNSLAETDESRLDTNRIQKALDTCSADKAVELKASGESNAFLSGPLELRTNVTLLIDKGVTLYASRNPKDYDTAPGGCGTSGAESRPCKPLISVHDVKNAAVMGEGVIDGRGDKGVIGKAYTWWQQSRAAEPTNTKYSAPRLIVANHADGLILYKIRLHNSPNFHVTINNTNGFTAWGVHLLTPTVRGTDARNTDGIDPGSSENITIRESWIDNGDDNIAIKTGTHRMSVLNNHFYSGHGMSMGSETYSGDSDILVDNLTLDRTTSGIRIKSNVQRGGSVRNVTYRHLCMRDVEVPISISPFYNGQTTDGIEDLGMKGDRIPDYKGLHLEDVHSLTPGILQVAGLNQDHPTEISFDGVKIDGIKPEQVRFRFTKATVGVDGVNFSIVGEGVSAPSANVSAPKISTCERTFLPYQN